MFFVLSLANAEKSSWNVIEELELKVERISRVRKGSGAIPVLLPSRHRQLNKPLTGVTV